MSSNGGTAEIRAGEFFFSAETTFSHNFLTNFLFIFQFFSFFLVPGKKFLPVKSCHFQSQSLWKAVWQTQS
jgi:hypothetical protein